MTRTLTQAARAATGKPVTLLAFCLLVAGCTSLQTGGDRDSAISAGELSRQGNHVAASRAYLDRALEVRGSERQRYLILAAGELYLANDLDGAERVLDQAGTPIAPENLVWWAEVEAELRLARGEPDAALQALNSVSSTDRQSAATRILLLRSEALFQLGRPETAVATLLQREALLDSKAEVDANRRLIWSGLQNYGNTIPPNLVARNGDPVLTGWLQIGHLAYRERGSLNGLYRTLSSWRQANPAHPASDTLLGEVLANLTSLSGYPHQVALLLPLSGKQRAVGEAIRDGYLAAHFEIGDNAERPDIRVYDSTADAAALYQRAVLDGAAFVVGPLLKDRVTAVAPLVNDVTTLALNSLPDDTTANSNLFQFALAPEDEARAAAARAVDDGLLNAVALVEDSVWGRRVLAAFRDELEARGGQLLAASGFTDTDTDFSYSIRKTLLLDESEARRDRLAANLGKKLEFEPRRRQDVDFIFLVSKTDTAKLIKPQLKFHYAGSIPTYATSAIYQPGSRDNSDLDGIFFPDIPWLLQPNRNLADHQAVLERYWRAGAQRYARFYAMGYDAYHLTALLHGRTGRNRLDMNGATGRLWADDYGVLHRELKWARVERGNIRTLQDKPRGLTQGDIVLMR